LDVPSDGEMSKRDTPGNRTKRLGEGGPSQRESFNDTRFLGSERNHYITVTCGSWEVKCIYFISLYKG
jgi:hypothetical protein